MKLILTFVCFLGSHSSAARKKQKQKTTGPKRRRKRRPAAEGWFRPAGTRAAPATKRARGRPGLGPRSSRASVWKGGGAVVGWGGGWDVP